MPLDKQKSVGEELGRKPTEVIIYAVANDRSFIEF